MSKIIVICCLCVSSMCFGQSVIQFSEPQPVDKSTVISVDKSLFGEYKNSSGTTSYIINEEGLFLKSIVVSMLTRAQVRESSHLILKGDYLHGMNGSDSLPCVSDGENLYFGIVKTVPIVAIGQTNGLVRLSSKEYVLNFHEGSYFEPSLLSFENGTMTVVHGDMTYKNEYFGLLQVNTLVKYGEEVKILAPTEKDWDMLRVKLFQGKRISYARI
jgi:hypothetical protein